jgi:hypothetical protein
MAVNLPGLRIPPRFVKGFMSVHGYTQPNLHFSYWLLIKLKGTQTTLYGSTTVPDKVTQLRSAVWLHARPYTDEPTLFDTVG